MPCPTCDHALALIASVEEAARYFHCARCGTAVVENDVTRRQTVYAPKLVERCREFERCLQIGGPLVIERDTWHALGIAEAINKPEDRK